MAKLSSINKNERRKKLVQKYASKYEKLKALANDESKDETERLIARLKMAELPRIRNGLGTIIVSTPRGVLSDAEARDQNVGGEVLAEVF